MDVVVDRLDGEVDHMSERLSVLEGKVTDELPLSWRSVVCGQIGE